MAGNSVIFRMTSFASFVQHINFQDLKICSVALLIIVHNITVAATISIKMKLQISFQIWTDYKVEKVILYDKAIIKIENGSLWPLPHSTSRRQKQTSNFKADVQFSSHNNIHVPCQHWNIIPDNMWTPRLILASTFLD